MKLYNIYYRGGQIAGMEDDKYECTTDNPKKWLGKHNKQRVADGEIIEHIDEFRIEEINVLFYNKGDSVNG
tara:strand:+ start:168 stop:380 length:213 start_codon:yes stop_codon:yes gene_type:complete